ncbi:MAG: hypothetical protein PWQ75_935, partial [Methanolobus sp.]|nr:hypothetical protein [Methanolobus sp.]
MSYISEIDPDIAEALRLEANRQ